MKKLVSNQLEFWQKVQEEYDQAYQHNVSFLCVASYSFRDIYVDEINNIRKLASQFIKASGEKGWELADSHLDKLFKLPFFDTFEERREIRNGFIQYCINKFSKNE